MNKGIFTLTFALLLISCSSHKRDGRNAIATISVENERIYIAPLINQSGIEKVDGWPQSEYEQKVLLKQFTILWGLLKSELQRCEKYGYYTVVEDDQNPSVRISITLDNFQLTEDSLLIPVNMQVEHIPDAKFFIYTLPTSSKLPSNLSRNQSSTQKLGMILSEYRRKFPYQLIVSFFYTQPHSTKK